MCTYVLLFCKINELIQFVWKWRKYSKSYSNWGRLNESEVKTFVSLPRFWRNYPNQILVIEFCIQLSCNCYTPGFMTTHHPIKLLGLLAFISFSTVCSSYAHWFPYPVSQTLERICITYLFSLMKIMINKYKILWTFIILSGNCVWNVHATRWNSEIV